MCKQEGERLNVYGICRNWQCLGVRTERSYRSRKEEEKRKAETILIGGEHTLGKEQKTRIFWSDGSGMDLMKNGVLTTGWGLVECDPEIQQDGTITIQQSNSWKGRSKMLESVQVCEARAILKAVQIVEAGEAVHIHTDSKGTVQKLRALMGKAYREKRAIKNKGILQEIIDTAQLKEIPIMIEWVKGHETMAASEHNWISRMKQEGNEMADKVAKEATKEEDLDRDFSIEQEWMLVSKRSQQYINWAALPKLYSEKRKTEGTQRLRTPKDTRISKYGQGARSQKVRANRTILHNMAMKAEGDIHFMTLKYIMNKIMTREFQSRQVEQAKAISKRAQGIEIMKKDYICPMCKLCDNKEVIQTKEHIWGGKCIVSKQAWLQMQNKIEQAMVKWTCESITREKIMRKIKEEW